MNIAINTTMNTTKNTTLHTWVRTVAAGLLIGFAGLAGAVQPTTTALPGDSVYQLPLPLTDSGIWQGSGATADARTTKAFGCCAHQHGSGA